MNRSIKAILFGKIHECRVAGELIQQTVTQSGGRLEYEICDDLEVYTQRIIDWNPTLLIVLADGAEGMESVYRSREHRPMAPVFWFSDDKDFSVLSFRLECAYFSVKPITPEKLSSAFYRCNRLGIRYGGN